MIYLDNAATSLRRPESVVRAVSEALCSLGNVGRGASESALSAARTRVSAVVTKIYVVARMRTVAG